MVICICGKSGSGKSMITNFLLSNNKNAVHLNIDYIGHESLLDLQVRENLLKYFGEEILTEDKIDRKKLGKLVFSSKDNMDKLSEITWSVMEKKIDEFVSNNKDRIIILDYFMLPLTKYFLASDLRILVESPYEERLKRIIKRDNVDEHNFLLREQNSLDYSSYNFDYIIENIEIKETEKEMKRIYDKSIISR